MSRETETKYTYKCDECGKELMGNFLHFEENSFDGTFYINLMNTDGNILKKISLSGDKDFCDFTCMINYLSKGWNSNQ